jgi:hypothetical protein
VDLVLAAHHRRLFAFLQRAPRVFKARRSTPENPQLGESQPVTVAVGVLPTATTLDPVSLGATVTPSGPAAEGLVTFKAGTAGGTLKVRLRLHLVDGRPARVAGAAPAPLKRACASTLPQSSMMGMPAPNTGVPSDAQVQAAIHKAQQKHKVPAEKLTLIQVRACLEKGVGALSAVQLARVLKGPDHDEVDHEVRPDGHLLGQDGHAGLSDNREEAAEVRARAKRMKTMRGGKPQETFELMNQIKANKRAGTAPSPRRTAPMPGQPIPADTKPEKP